MKIELNKLHIENFKGIKKFQAEFNGDNAVIKAKNGVGKTTVFDAFLWLLFGKDSTGRKDFELRPLDKHNQPIKGLVLGVTAELNIDGQYHTFTKEHTERIVKKELKGFETACFIDDVPKKAGEFQDYITDIIAEDTFKLLTDLDQFNGKLHWTDRRKVLLNMAGDIGTPKGFVKLIDTLNGRSIADYKKVLKNQKDGYEKEQLEINPRIDEIQKGLSEYATGEAVDVKKLEALRIKVTQDISKLRVDRQNLMGQETERQCKLNALNNLKSRKITREVELQNDTSGVKSLLDEKQKLEIVVSDKQSLINNIRHGINQLDNSKQTVIVVSDGHTKRISELAKEYEATQNLTFEDDFLVVNFMKQIEQLESSAGNDICPTCNQKLPADIIAKSAENKKNQLAELSAKKNERLTRLISDRDIKLQAIAKDGFEMKSKIEIDQKNIDELNEKLQALKADLDKANGELSIIETSKTARFSEIDEAIKNNPKTKPEDDTTWQNICRDIEAAEKQIGEPIGVQLEKIETSRIAKEAELEGINKTLNNADNITKANKRIEELKARESELGQLIADVEALLAQIDDYNMAESKAIEAAVNDKFKHVKFKLFEYLLNGSINECCEAIFNGVPYKDMSTGQKIFVGLDIVNVLSAYYGISVPLFIDHAESVTLPLETELHTIKLFAKEGVSKLTIKLEEKELANVK